MVCMSSSETAPRVIRAGARIAARLGATWYAVYVETPREAPGRINAKYRETLASNIQLRNRWARRWCGSRPTARPTA